MNTSMRSLAAGGPNPHFSTGHGGASAMARDATASQPCITDTIKRYL